MALWKRGRRYWTYFSINGVQLRRPLCPPGSTLATTNWQEATRLEKEMIRAALEGELAPRDPSVKLFAAIDDYLEAKKTTANSERTIEFDQERLDIVKQHLGDVKLSAITRKVIEGYQAKRRLEGASNRTINMDVGALRQVLKRFKQWRRLEGDVKMLTEAGGAPVGRALTPEERKRLFEAAASKLSTPPVVWLPRTGIGHTRHFFRTKSGASTGSAVFDTFAAMDVEEPLVFDWPDVTLVEDDERQLKRLLCRLLYFGRSESWCDAELESVHFEPGDTHWPCVAVQDDAAFTRHFRRGTPRVSRLHGGETVGLGSRPSSISPRPVQISGVRRAGIARTRVAPADRRIDEARRSSLGHTLAPLRGTPRSLSSARPPSHTWYASH